MAYNRLEGFLHLRRLNRVMLLGILSVMLAQSHDSPPVLAQECVKVLLAQPGWTLQAESEATEAYVNIPSDALRGATHLIVTLDLHGTIFLQNDDATSLIIDDNGDWYAANVTPYAQNGLNGPQTIRIPVADFKGLGKNEGVPPDFSETDGTLHIRIWYPEPYRLDILSVEAAGCAGAGPDPDSELTPTFVVSTPDIYEDVAPVEGTFQTRSVSTMKLTKDRVRSPLSQSEIQIVIDQAIRIGANMLSLETPYDNPTGGDSVAYTYAWIQSMRAAGLLVWHRHMPLKFEGIYDEPKEKRARVASEAVRSVPNERLDQYLVQIYQYIVDHPDMFREGDIFTPAPEPDSRGVPGIGDCSDGSCMFESVADFNQWVIDAIHVSQEAFEVIGLGGKIQIGYYGFSGFTAAGLNNTDWKGKSFLTCEAIEAMGGVVAIDHYPPDEVAMATELAEATSTLTGTCPTDFVTLAIAEYGATDPARIDEAMTAFVLLGLPVVNYWSIQEGDTALLDDDGNPNQRFTVVSNFYHSN